ncbi:MAG: FlgD immunoglobulin-like domain containing protein [candidate division WOR-3 bacterium]
MKAGMVLAVAFLVAAAFAVPGLTATGPTETGPTADVIGSPQEHTRAPIEIDGFTYTVEWAFGIGQQGCVGVTGVQDTLVWVSSGGVSGGTTDTNWILVFDARTRVLLDSFKQYVQAGYNWGYRDMYYDRAENAVYAGCENNRMDKINATTRALIATYTLTGSPTPSIVRGITGDGDSLYVSNFGTTIIKCSKTGTNCHTVAPAGHSGIYGLGLAKNEGQVYASTASYDYSCLRYNYPAWTLRDTTLITQITGGTMGGCEMFRGDTFLLVLGQMTQDSVFCLRRIAGVANDVGVSTVLSPPSAMTPGTIAPKAQLRNFGTAAQTGFPVSCWIDSGATRVYNQTVTYTGSLPGGGIDSVAFPNWTSGPAGAQYRVTMFTSLPGDQNQANDTSFRNVTISGAVFSETIHVRRIATDAPTIDGVISPGEWAASVWYDISDLANRGGSGARPAGSVYMYFLYDSSPGFIYMACDVPPVATRTNYDQFGPYVDEDHSHTWSTDSSEGNHWVEYVSADSVVYRALLNTVPNVWRMPGQCPGAVSASGTTSGHLQIEAKIQLGALKGDLTVDVGDTVGYFMYMAQAGSVFWGWWPQSLLMANWANPAYYGHMIFDASIVGAEERPQGTLFALEKVAPTLVRESGRISYYVGTRANTSLCVYDEAGKLVRTLAQGVTEPGTKTVVWDRTDNAGARVAAGTYFYRLVVDGKPVSAKTILLD